MATPAGWGRGGDLPAELTSFVGRVETLATVTAALHGDRLVTLTGIGGVGKTRVALRAARTDRQAYSDGVWFVDLSGLRDPALLPATIAATFGAAGRQEIDTLTHWLPERAALLILDTCEHLVDACRELVAALLSRPGPLRILVTSRQPLGLPAEHVVPVPPLTPPGTPGEDPLSNEAVRLFEERAAAAVPGFRVGPAEIGPVTRLCRSLDGIPLAIELAAVRLRVLSVRQILDLLTDRFRLLGGTGRGGLSRHQTLRTAIGWSYELCEPAERLLWARLSVFEGDFELDAARYVCEEGPLSGADVAALISGLVDKSILVAHDDEPRYRLIETLREYGADWLDRLGETAATRRRHRDYYLLLAQRGERAWSGPRQLYWFDRMRQEHHNVCAALEFCLSDPAETQVGLELLSSLWFMWVACGFSREGHFYLRRVLAACEQPSRARGRALGVLAYVRSAQGDAEGAIRAAERCRHDAIETGDSATMVLATKMLGTAAMLQGDLLRAKALLGAAIEVHGDGAALNPGLLPAIVELSLVLTIQDSPDEAERLLTDCLRVCRLRNELWVRSYGHYVLAEAQRALGRTAEATANAAEALRLKRHFHDVLGCVLAVEVLARLAADEGRTERAALLLGGAQHNWHLFGLPQLGSPFLTEEHEQCVRECRRALGDEGYERLSGRGAGLGLDAVVELAMNGTETTGVG